MAEAPGAPTGESCGTCNAWLPQQDGFGLCRAHPPMPMFGAHVKQPGPGVPEQESYAPETAADWWCREWKLAVAAPTG